ncbi:MAG: type II toxin-antitoxin system RelE/ParE family toxin [Thermomicrobiales bacterium]
MAQHRYEIVPKSTFMNQLFGLPQSTSRLIWKKTTQVLQEDPAPDTKNKKRLVELAKPTFRLEHGDYRVIYRFSEPDKVVRLLAVGHRSTIYNQLGLLEKDPEDHYKVDSDDSDLEEIRNPEPELAREDKLDPGLRSSSAKATCRIRSVRPSCPGCECQKSSGSLLVHCQDLDYLYEVEVPDWVKNRVFDNLFHLSLDDIENQSDLDIQSLKTSWSFPKGDFRQLLASFG